MQQDPGLHSCVNQRHVFAAEVQLSLIALTTVTCAVTCDEHPQEFCLGGPVSAPKPQQSSDISCQDASLGFLPCPVPCCYLHTFFSHQSLALAAGQV